MRPSEEVVARRLDEETVLVHLGTNRIFTLNATAARLWELLQEGHDCETIERRMRAEFDVDGAELAREIESVLESLRAEALIMRDG